jgi:hypothetical protein
MSRINTFIKSLEDITDSAILAISLMDKYNKIEKEELIIDTIIYNHLQMDIYKEYFKKSEDIKLDDTMLQLSDKVLDNLCEILDIFRNFLATTDVLELYREKNISKKYNIKYLSEKAKKQTDITIDKLNKLSSVFKFSIRDFKNKSVLTIRNVL